jgi:hypothetical protein
MSSNRLVQEPFGSHYYARRAGSTAFRKLRARASRWVFGDKATEKPFETTSDDYVSRAGVMDQRGSVPAIKCPGQLAKEVL